MDRNEGRELKEDMEEDYRQTGPVQEGHGQEGAA